MVKYLHAGILFPLQGCVQRGGARLPRQAAGVGCFVHRYRNGVLDNCRPHQGGDRAIRSREQQLRKLPVQRDPAGPRR